MHFRWTARWLRHSKWNDNWTHTCSNGVLSGRCDVFFVIWYIAKWFFDHLAINENYIIDCTPIVIWARQSVAVCDAILSIVQCLLNVHGVRAIDIGFCPMPCEAVWLVSVRFGSVWLRVLTSLYCENRVDWTWNVAKHKTHYMERERKRNHQRKPVQLLYLIPR